MFKIVRLFAPKKSIPVGLALDVVLATVKVVINISPIMIDVRISANKKAVMNLGNILLKSGEISYQISMRMVGLRREMSRNDGEIRRREFECDSRKNQTLVRET